MSTVHCTGCGTVGGNSQWIVVTNLTFAKELWRADQQSRPSLQFLLELVNLKLES